MFRTGLMCACLLGLSACVATPSGPAEFVSGERQLPQAQLDLRRNAAELDARFHEAGWVAEVHGAAMQRLTGILMFGRGNSDRPTPVEVYYQAAGLTEEDTAMIVETARRDLAEASTLTYNLARDGEAVAEATGLTAGSLSDDLGALEYALTDVRQALALFRSIHEEDGESLNAEIGSLELASERLNNAANALMSRRRELRNAPGS